MENKKEIKLKINDKELRGVYSNQIAVMHSKYEFVLDFISVFPPEALVNSRIILNPASYKKISNAINENLKRYEKKFGIIDISEDKNEEIFPGKIN